MEKEFNATADAGTFGAVKQPSGLNVITAKGVYP